MVIFGDKLSEHQLRLPNLFTYVFVSLQFQSVYKSFFVLSHISKRILISDILNELHKVDLNSVLVH